MPINSANIAPKGAFESRFAGLLLADAALEELSLVDFTTFVLVLVLAARLVFFAPLLLVFLVAIEECFPSV